MTRAAKHSVAILALVALASCGREGSPTAPSGPTSFLTGTWRGTVTIQVNPGDPNPPPPSTGDMTWTFEAVPQTNLQSLRATMRVRHGWTFLLQHAVCMPLAPYGDVLRVATAVLLHPNRSMPTTTQMHAENPDGHRGEVKRICGVGPGPLEDDKARSICDWTTIEFFLRYRPWRRDETRLTPHFMSS
jgi:hypothetical protein